MKKQYIINSGSRIIMTAFQKITIETEPFKINKKEAY